MNLSARWVVYLERSGYAAVHWSSIGAANAPDAEIMAYAKARRWMILTNDLDFSAMLLRSGEEEPTVMQIRADDLRVESVGRVVLSALAKMAELPAQGALITVDQNRTRIRVLPFPRRV